MSRSDLFRRFAVAEKKISSTIVGPNGMHWCRACKVYVRGTKVSIQEHEQTGRHKHNYRESLKEKKFLDKVDAMQDSVLSAELRRMEREANVAMGLPDVPHIAVPKPLHLDLRLPSASSRARQQQHDAADANEPFVPKYVPVVRTAAVAPLGPAAVVDDVEAAFRAQIASATVVAAAEPGEWTAVETGESLEQQQQEHHDQQQKQQQQEQQQRRQQEQQRKQVDSDDDDDGDNGTVHSGPRHLGTAMASAVAAADVTFKKRKGESAAKNRSVRKKIDDDDDNP